MIITSCRKGFDSDKFLAKGLQIRNYPHPDKPDEFTKLSLAKLKAKAKNKHVCILVHGYSNPLPGVLNAYGELQKRMKKVGIATHPAYGLLVGFTWPGWWGPEFPLARHSANYAARALRKLIHDLRPEALSIDIQTHSLGARVALGALKNPKTVFIDNLMLTAPAVDNTVFKPGREFHHALDACNRCFVYHSKRDTVLKIYYPAGDFFDSVCPALG